MKRVRQSKVKDNRKLVMGMGRGLMDMLSVNTSSCGSDTDIDNLICKCVMHGLKKELELITFGSILI